MQRQNEQRVEIFCPFLLFGAWGFDNLLLFFYFCLVIIFVSLTNRKNEIQS